MQPTVLLCFCSAVSSFVLAVFIPWNAAETWYLCAYCALLMLGVLIQKK